MVLLIVATLLAVVGGANVLFAFVPPPAAIEPMFDGFSRRIRFIVSFLPEDRRVMVARLLTGLVLLGAGAFAASVWVSR